MNNVTPESISGLISSLFLKIKQKLFLLISPVRCYFLVNTTIMYKYFQIMIGRWIKSRNIIFILMYHPHKLLQISFYDPNLWDSECFETLIFPELFNVITCFKIFSNNMAIWKFRLYTAECTGLITWRGLWFNNCRSHNNLPMKTNSATLTLCLASSWHLLQSVIWCDPSVMLITTFVNMEHCVRLCLKMKGNHFNMFCNLITSTSTNICILYTHKVSLSSVNYCLISNYSLRASSKSVFNFNILNWYINHLFARLGQALLR
jgi:hypothetical protein